MAASSITIVTKDTAQNYLGGATASAKGTVLTVLEVDSNFINLKEGIIVLENTVTANYNHFTSEINTLDTDLREYVDDNFVAAFNAVLTGTPRAPTPGGSTSSPIQTVDGVTALINPISSLVNSPTTGNLALQSFLNLKADLSSPSLTGFPRLTGSSYNFSTWDGVTQYLAPVEYVQDKLENLSGDVKPASAGGADLGTATEHFNELHVNAILPAGSNATIGTPTNRFPFGYFDTGDFGPNTILVGDAEISADGSTLVVPVNTAIGEQDNVLPLNIASTVVDKRFGGLSLTQALDQTFTASGAITARDAVAINADGTVSTISSSVSNLNYVGIALSSAADAGTLSVRVHGEVSGFTGLTDGDTVFVEDDGSLVQTKTTTALKIGTAVSATEILCFTTSNLDTYLLNITKAELDDFSASNASTASGSGGISYDSATGQFTFTPADTTSFATTNYVDTEIANLVNSAPTSLDTLDELAAALNDDANFASTVTNSIATKAPLASPALTGAPTAPTASGGTNTTQIATTAYVQSELSGLGNASLTSFSVSTGSASGGGSLAYNNTNGIFTFVPADLSNVLTSYTETDPVVGAINGIVKADGSGNISAAVAGTDYSTFDGAFSSLSATPTTISGYGITDAASLASPTFTGTPSGPTATSGTNTTQLATTAFVQSAVSGSAGIALTDLSVTTNAANSGGALGYNDATGVFTFTPADQAFSSITATPTTLSGYGITDAAPLASPTFTGTPAAPTAASGTSTTQLATTAFVQGEISGFSSTGGDSQKSYTSSSAITQGDAVVLDSAGTVSSVVVSSPGAGSATALDTALYATTTTSYDDYNNLYYFFFVASGEIRAEIITPDFANLTTTNGTAQVLVQSVTTADKFKYIHLPGTSTGIIVYNTASGYQARLISQSGGTFTVNSPVSLSNSGDTIRDITLGPSNTPLLLIEDYNAAVQVAAITVSGTTLSIGTYDQVTGFTNIPADIFYAQNKIVVADPVGTTLEYAVGTISGTTVSMNAATNVSVTNTYADIYYHGGSGYFVLTRGVATSQNEGRLYLRTLAFNGTTLTAGVDVDTGWAASRQIQSNYQEWQFSSSGTGIAAYAFWENYSNQYIYYGFGTISSSGTFTKSTNLASLATAENGKYTNPGAVQNKDGYGLFITRDYSTAIGGTGQYTRATLVRLDSVSNSDSWLGIAESTVSSSASVNVILAGGVADVYTGLTPNTDYYVQDDGTVTTTSSDVFAGVAVASTALQVADSKNTFRQTIQFADLANKPTTLSGYGISGDIDIGSSDFITTGKSYYANMFATTGDLPNATTYHGMFAHVHGTGAGYFAHAGNWVELANKSYVDTEVANLVNSAPATLNTLDELAAALNDDANFATTVTTSLGLKAPLASPALTGTPTAPTASSGTNSTQIATTAFVAAAVSGLGGGGGASVTTSDAAPSSPSAGDLWYNTDAGGLFLYYTDADSSQWVEVVGKTGPTGAAGGSTITVSDAAPSSPVAGQLWWNSTSNKLYIYYTDANSSQWVQATTPGADGATGATGAAGASPGRNKFINGNFDVWQRGTSRTTSGHLADRWRTGVVGNSQCTFSQQSFTLGQTDVPFNPKYYHRAVVIAGSDANSYVLFNQRIEDVRTFQGETVTVSFWAKADAAKDFALEPFQGFGTGGSPSTSVPITPQTVTLSTTWTKYTKTFSIPSITGKTLGTDENSFLGFFFWLDAGSDWNSRAGSLGNQSGTFDFAQIQVERGSTATDFETEHYSETLRKCQRYYYEYPKGETYSFIGTGFSTTSTKAHIFLQYPVPMRAAPTQTSTGNFQIIDGGSRTVTAFQLIDATSFNARLDCTASGQTQGRGCMLRNNNDANATIMLEAEI